MGEKIKRGTKRWGAAFVVLAMYVWLAVGPMVSQWIDSLGDGGFRAVSVEKWVKFLIDTSLVAFVTIRSFQSKRWHEANGEKPMTRSIAEVTGESPNATAPNSSQ